MNVTKEAIEQRLAELQAQFDQMQIQAHAIGGAMQDCKYWITALEQADAPTGESPCLTS